MDGRRGIGIGRGRTFRVFRRALAVVFAASMFAAPNASADPGFPQDDKNNPTAPGHMQGPAWENRNVHCTEHYAGIKGGGSENVPAQCQVE